VAVVLLAASQPAAAVAAGACRDAASLNFMVTDSLSKRGRWTFLRRSIDSRLFSHDEKGLRSR